MKAKRHGDKVGEADKPVKPEHGFTIRERRVTVKKTGKVYTYWVLDLGKVDGKRRQLQFDSREACEREAERVTRQQRRIGNDAKRISEDDLRDAVAALELLAHKKTLVEVAQFYLRHGAGEGGEVCVGDLFARFMAEKESRNLSPKTIRDLRNRLRHFVEAFERTAAHQVTVHDVDAYLTKYKGVVDRDNHRRCVANLFSYALRRNYVQRNVVLAIEPPKKEHRPPPVLTPDQARALMRSAEEVVPAMVPYFALALFAGLRPDSEIRRMDWSRINFDERIVDVPGAYSKVRQHRRNVHMEDALVHWLAPHRQSAGPIYYKRRDYDRVRAKAMTLVTHRWANDIMRHTYASYHHERFRDLAATAKNMGDNPRTVEARYVNLVKPSEAKAYWEIMPTATGNVIQLARAMA